MSFPRSLARALTASFFLVGCARAEPKTSTTEPSVTGADTVTVGVGALGGDAGSAASTADASTTVPTTGCARPRVDRGFVAGRTIGVDGSERTYDLFVPEDVDPSAPMPIVFVFHADTGTSIRSVLGMEAATKNEAIVVYPYGRGAWDLSAPDENPDYTFVAALRETLVAEACGDPKRVFAFGFSNGGFLAQMIACYRGKSAFQAISVNSGGLYAPPGMPQHYDDNGHLVCPAAPVSAMIIHGTKDNQVSYKDDGLGAYGTWTTANGCPAATKALPTSPCVESTTCDANRVALCSLPGFGHAIWPSAAAASWGFFRGL